jgi:predicted nucleotidyltransferase
MTGQAGLTGAEVAGGDEKLAAFVTAFAELEVSSLLAGLYLVGSHALGDVRPNSDIDFVAVLYRSPQGHGLSTLAAVHDRLRAACPDPPLDGDYVSVADLLRPAEDVVPAGRAGRGRVPRPMGRQPGGGDRPRRTQIAGVARHR